MFFIDRRYIRSFDWVSFFLTFALAGIGLLFVFSATYRADQPFSIFFKKQALGIATGLVIYFLCCATDYRSLMRWGYFAYVGVIGLLAFTIVKGSIGMGAQRWINLGLFRLQPSELAKVLFPAFATYYFYTENPQQQFHFKQFVPALLMLAVSFVLILKQPDLGTALILTFSGFTMLWLAGLSRKFFVYSSILFILCAPLSWHILKPYQKQRIFVFLGHGDTQRERYQIEQSKIAIGSGGITGKGFLRGTQNRLQFLPESRTDFIFSVIAEELGFIGALSLILLYALLAFRLLAITCTITEPFAQLLALGVIIHIILSAVINIGMVIGFLPIVGIPLPLISYGVSNLWMTFASLGWFNGIAMRRFYINTRRNT